MFSKKQIFDTNSFCSTFPWEYRKGMMIVLNGGKGTMLGGEF